MNKTRVQSYDKIVAAAATPESLLVADKETQASEILLKAREANTTDDVLIGGADDQTFPLPKGAPIRLSEILNRMSYGGKYELAEIFVNVGTNGDGVHVLVLNSEDK